MVLAGTKNINFMMQKIVLAFLLLISFYNYSQKKMKIPPYLKKGDTVAIVCTARKFMPEDAKTCYRIIRKLGFES